MTTIDESGAAHELDFWKGFVKTQRFLDGWCGNYKTPELRQEVADFILSVPHAKVLDVGSGVVSLLHGLSPEIDLTAADPLGMGYSTIFDYAKRSLPMPFAVAAEDLTEFFKGRQFDIVHCSNALDHSVDPVKAYESMMELVKPGGHLIIQGFENEGVFEKYQGLHQWNLHIDELDQLVLSDKTGPVKYLLPDTMATTVTLDTGKRWIIWIVKK